MLVALAVLGRDSQWLRERSRLGPNTIDRVLNDPRRGPGPRTLERVAEVLGVPATWLTADVSRRELTPDECDELLRCVHALRRLARGSRIDPRAEPNVRPAPERRVPRPFVALGVRQAYRVRGRSLSGFGLLDGDVVYVRTLPRDGFRNAIGSLVLFRWNGALYLKQLTVAPGGVVVLRQRARRLRPHDRRRGRRLGAPRPGRRVRARARRTDRAARGLTRRKPRGRRK